MSSSSSDGTPKPRPRAGSTGKKPTTASASESSRGSTPSADAARVLLFTGPQSEQKIKEAQRVLAENVDADFADFDAETLDGATTSTERVLAAVSIMPFGTGKRTVLVRDAQQLSDEDQKRLAGALDRIHDQALLLLHTGAPIVEEGKTKRGSVVVPELAQAVKKVGRVIDFALPRAEDLRGWIQSEAQALGKQIAGDALSLLTQLPSEDLRRLRTEIAKAADYAGPDARAITVADIEATLSRGPDDVIFKLCEAVGARRRAEALGHVSTLFRSGGGRAEGIAPRALVLLARQIRLLAQFHYLNERQLVGRGNSGALPPEVQSLLPGDGAESILANPRMRWMADRYIGQARHFTSAELGQRLELLLQADLALKGIGAGGDMPQALMQKLVIALC